MCSRLESLDSLIFQEIENNNSITKAAYDAAHGPLILAQRRQFMATLNRFMLTLEDIAKSPDNTFLPGVSETAAHVLKNFSRELEDARSIETSIPGIHKYNYY
jgi:hypothetical protein